MGVYLKINSHFLIIFPLDNVGFLNKKTEGGKIIEPIIIYRTHLGFEARVIKYLFAV